MKNLDIRRLREVVNPAEFPRNLTPRQREVVEAMADYGSRKVVADRLGIGTETVSEHMRVIGLKAGARSAVLIVSRYLRATLAAA